MSEGSPSQRPLLVALAGQPNVGKSTVFNLLTGLRQHVGNWPGKTVERREGTCLHGDREIKLIDLPGTYSLGSNSPEERVARDFILHERPDVIVFIADASAIERNLYLLAELLWFGVPVVVGLNMMDVARSHGVELEPHVLAAALGTPVVPLVATRADGVSALMTEALRAVATPHAATSRPHIAAPHRPVLESIRGVLAPYVPEPYDDEWVALKLLEGDADMTVRARSWVPADAWQPIEAQLRAHEDAVLDIASARYEWIGRMVRAGVKRPRLGQVGLTDRLDRYAVHPLWGLALLLCIFTLLFGVTFGLGRPMQLWVDQDVVVPLRALTTQVLSGAPQWLSGMLADGVLGGAGIVLTFLPVLFVFFASLALLEDTGYLARAAYVMDRFMHWLGLHGKSCLPLFVGFGCNVPAIMGARVIESQTGRLMTIVLAPLVPCSARLAVLAFLTPVFFGSSAVFVAVGLVTLNLVVLAILGIALNRTVFRGQRSPFIMELPLYHVPNARTILRSAWNSTAAMAGKAGGVIVVMSLIVWVLASVPGPGIENSYLAAAGRALAPLSDVLGMDWRLLTALFTSFIAKENAIATLGVLYGGALGDGGLTAAVAAQVTPAAGLAFLVATMLFIPCAATVAIMHRETGSWRWAALASAMMLTIAFACAAAVYGSCTMLGLGVAHA